MIIDSYISPLGFYHGVQTGILMSWFLGEIGVFYKFKHEFL